MDDFAIRYLSYFGYLAGNVKSVSADPYRAMVSYEAAVREFQAMAGIPATGELDAATLMKMKSPRCGCRDVQKAVVAQSRWQKNTLTYFVEKRVGGLPPGDVDDLIAMAWKDWTDVADLKLTRVNVTNADIVISTGRGRADDFDGESGVLAWAFLPNGNDGQLLCRFDLDENWLKDNPAGGILFRNVACHEFGHLLGLDHSRVSSALMAPFYSPATPSPKQTDDLPRIVALYGKATAPAPPPVPGPPLPANFIRFAKRLPAGTYGDFTLGSAIGPGDYLTILAGDAEPPPVVPNS